MADIFPAAMQRPKLLEFLAALAGLLQCALASRKQQSGKGRANG
jgi:hypothetical protein